MVNVYVVSRLPVSSHEFQSRSSVDQEVGPISVFSNRKAAEMEVMRLDYKCEYEYAHGIYELELQDGDLD